MRLFQTLLGPAVVLISFSANAKCEHPPTAWEFGKSFSATWRTDGAVCTSTSNHPENIAEIKVIEKPKHGIAGKNGRYGIAYRPTPGFKGSDSFVYTVTSNGNYQKGPGLVAHVTINVVVK